MDILKQIRRHYGISQYALARELGVTQVAISRLENGDLVPSAQLADKINQTFAKIVQNQPLIKRRTTMGYTGYQTLDELINALKDCRSREEVVKTIKDTNSIARISLIEKLAHKFRESKIVDGEIQFTDEYDPVGMSTSKIVSILEEHTDYLDY